MSTAPVADTISSKQIVAEAGITYRMLDYWVRAGVLPSLNPTPGHGVARRFDRSAIRLAKVLRQVAVLGLVDKTLAKTAPVVADLLESHPEAGLLTLALSGGNRMGDGQLSGEVAVQFHTDTLTSVHPPAWVVEVPPA